MNTIDLNDDVLVNIFTYLPRKTIVRTVPLVCRAWNTLIHGSDEYNQQCKDLFAKRSSQNIIVRKPALGKDYMTNYIWKEFFMSRFPEKRRDRTREKEKQKKGKPPRPVTEGEPNWKMKYLERTINGKHCSRCRRGNILTDKTLVKLCNCRSRYIHRQCHASGWWARDRCNLCGKKLELQYQPSEPQKFITTSLGSILAVVLVLLFLVLWMIGSLTSIQAWVTGSVISMTTASLILWYNFPTYELSLKEIAGLPNPYKIYVESTTPQ